MSARQDISSNPRGLRKDLLIIVFAVLVLYVHTLPYVFSFDDAGNIVRNEVVQGQEGDIWSPLQTRSLGGGGLEDHVKSASVTRFLVYLSFYANHSLHGLNSAGFRFVNIALHAANAVLVYALALSLLGLLKRGEVSEKRVGGTREQALFAALFFALHPLQTEAVVYVSQRFTLLVSFFYLLSVWLYVEGRALDNKRYLAGAWAAALAAMFCKENSFTLPFMLFVAEAAFFTGPWQARLKRLLPFGLLMAVVPLSLLDLDSARVSEALSGASRSGDVYGRYEYLATQARVLVTYFRLILLPFNQTLDYSYPLYRSFQAPEVFLSAVFVAALLALGFYLVLTQGGSKKEGGSGLGLLAGFGFVWFYVALSVESSVIPLQNLIFEHRVYLPLAGLSVPLSMALWAVATRLRERKPPIALMAALLALMFLASFARAGVWQSDVTLWGDVVRKAPEKVRGQYNLGTALLDEGRFEESVLHLREALRLDPEAFEAYINLGNALLGLGDMTEARRWFMELVKRQPESAAAHYGVGVSYMKERDFDRALLSLKQAMKYDGRHALAYFYAGNIYALKGNLAEAEGLFLKALESSPEGLRDAHKMLAAIYLKQGRREEARRHLEEAGPDE